MAKVQSRRCVSLNRNVYEDLKRYSKSSGVPMSAFIEDLIRAAMADWSASPSVEMVEGTDGKVTIHFDAPDAAIKPGLTATVRVKIP